MLLVTFRPHYCNERVLSSTSDVRDSLGRCLELYSTGVCGTRKHPRALNNFGLLSTPETLGLSDGRVARGEGH